MNSIEKLTQADVGTILGPNRDGRDFIARTFKGIYFPAGDLSFLDAAWSNLEVLSSFKRDIAISALCLAAARKQPRGVFTVTDHRYDDGRRSMRMPLQDLFVEAIAEYNRVVFDNGQQNAAHCEDVFKLDPQGFDLVYFDPPYAPPRDDNDYIKRYHFLEGLAVYWKGLRIMEETKSKKLEKRFTPFSYKRTIAAALAELFARFRKSTIVLSYSSNSVPSEDVVVDLLKREKSDVEVYAVPHRYSFGTHSTAQRRQAHEYIFIAR
jgi:DNA adenine methylase/adenine-specific DNA-methyltransferase